MKFLSRVTTFQSLDALIVLFIYSNKIFIYEHTSQKVQMGWYILKVHKVNGCQVPTQLMTQRSAPFHVSTCYVKTNFVTFLVFLKRQPCKLKYYNNKEKTLRYENSIERRGGILVEKWERGYEQNVK